MEPDDLPEIRRIRITLTSRNVKNVEKVCNNLKAKALQKSHLVRAGDKEYQSVRVHGPVRMPTKKLKLCVMKAPNGEGTTTWDRFEMRIHKRVLELFCAKEVVSQIANIAMEPGVTVDVMDSSSGKLLDSTNYSVGVRTLVYSNKGLTLNDEV